MPPNYNKINIKIPKSYMLAENHILENGIVAHGYNING